ncbi:adenylosuccinate lyase [Oscillibacter sp.]|uniref:adenylosuccinate lyase n=1 Tax=Oscillibacter sp. TaxID=1945593 RepID=UPI0026183E9A|nr:adenylosuccinate lyase [Oscillibacter sp.]MDD3347881.1 adenylosuccinate lyase [Oscillibacter sp.]
MSKDRYESPLASRYASDFMLHLFSADRRIETWRRLWVALARAEHNLGLPVTAEQVAELEAHLTDIDYDCAAAREKEVRHDVMAHVYTYGKAAPSAAGIIHLGATSCYVTDNADLILYREGLRYLRGELCAVLSNLSQFARQYAATPTLGYTHYQPAQLVTVGKRATLWMQDLLSDLEELDFVLDNLKFLGCRGTTGTEASFLDLFEGDGGKIDEMNRQISAEFGFDKCFSVCGQTYPRKVDSRILNVLSAIAQSLYRMANDIRLLQHDRQVEEPFEKNQIGSSAMAYKRNPMRSERICSLSRYLMADAMNAPMTASVQWLERTLDDSANRRISMPEGFLCADAILRLAQNVTDGLHVNEKVVDATVREYLPFIATENLMMEAVKRGGDRQELHEIIRTCSMAATAKMKEGEKCDLLRRLAQESAFGMTEAEMAAVLTPSAYIGRCSAQVEAFLKEVEPLLGEAGGEKPEINL